MSQYGDISPRVVPHLMVPSNFQLYSLAFDTLLMYDAHLQAQPRLATSWKWSPDARQITLELRTDARFHNGRPFTSADARANLERLRDPSVGSQWMSYANQMHIETPDPGTLIVNFEAPNKSSLDALAGTFMADPSTFDTNTFVGTGPFRVQEYTPGDHLTFDRNPDYWQQGRPYLDGVVLRVQPDQQTAIVALESGNLDWVAGVAGEDARRLQSDAAYQVILTGSGGGTFFIVGLDTSISPLADRRVREAFGYAINRQRMVDSALAGYGRPASIIWPRQALGYDAGQDQTYVYDLDRARLLLAEAGWDPTVRIPLRVVGELRPVVLMAEILQSDLNAIGVNAVIDRTSAAEGLAMVQKRQVGGAWIAPTGMMNVSPSTFFTGNLFARVPNPSNFASTQYTDLIAQAIAATDDGHLKSVVHDLTQVMLDEAFVIPIAQSDGPNVARSSVKDIAWNNQGMYMFENVWLDR